MPKLSVGLARRFRAADIHALLDEAIVAARLVSRASVAAFFQMNEGGEIRHHFPGDDRSRRLLPYLEAALSGVHGRFAVAERFDDSRKDARFNEIAAAATGDLCAFIIVPVYYGGQREVPGGGAASGAKGLPTFRGGELCGLLMVAHPLPNRFGESEEDLLSALAIQMGVALENARIYDEVSRRNKVLTVLNRVAVTLVVEHDREAVLRRVLEACCQVTEADSALLEYRAVTGESLRLMVPEGRDLLQEVLPLPLSEQVLSGRTLLVPDLRREGTNDLLWRMAPRSLLALPLCSGIGAFVGGVYLAHGSAGHFDDTHAEMVRALVSQAIVAIERMLAAEQSAGVRRELESIFHSIADPVTVLQSDLTIVDCNDGLLLRLGKSRDQVIGQHYFKALVGNVEEGMWNVAPLVFRTGKPQTARVPMVTGEGASLLMDVTAYPVRDAQGSVVKVVEYAKEVTAEVRLQLALLDRNKELNEATENLALQKDELDRLNRQLQEKCKELERIAVTDVMTGLPNHRAFQQGLMREMRRAQRHGANLSLLLIDVDHFKLYNDTYGHPAGDEVLAQVGRLLAGTLRDVDLPARYGGEEFAVVLPYTDKMTAQVVAEKIRAAIEGHRFPKRAVTVSIGVATFPDDAADKASLTSMADQALYAAKQAGRNTVHVWSTLPVIRRAA